MKKIIILFIAAFILNLIWENLHSVLYDNYLGGKITELILLRATLADAIITTVIIFPFIFFPLFKKFDWMIVPALIIVSIWNEYFALHSGTWAYNSLMPIIPFISVGLTPVVQLGLLGYLSYKIQERVKM